MAFNPGTGPDYWIWSVGIAGLGSTMTGINFAVTIYKERAPGMDLFRMPLFSWTVLCTAIIMIFAMPPLTVATATLALDRYLDFHFFTNDLGGNMMNYVNLFWLFGHPEVYLLILPAYGIFSELVSTFSAKRLYGYFIVGLRHDGNRSTQLYGVAAPFLHHGSGSKCKYCFRHRLNVYRCAYRRQNI